MDFAEYWPLIPLFLCVFGVLFAYAIYPVLILVSAKLFGRKNEVAIASDAELPRLALVIAAYNEAGILRERIENALALEYPKDKWFLAICTDGSTDGTDSIVEEYEAKYPGRVRHFASPSNCGKAAALNAAIPEIQAELLVLSDANTAMKPDALRRLASWFSQADVGVVCGRLVLTDCTTGNNVDGIYWKYETFLKKCEGRLGALLGSNGAIYGIRRNLFPVIPHGTIIDDFYIPLEAKRVSGCRIVYDTHSVAYEETATSIGAEFKRRSRIGAGGFQAIGLLYPLLNPKHGWVAFAFLCHKVLRWCCPFLLLIALVSNALLIDTTIGQILLAMQFAGYGLAAIGPWIPKSPKAFRLLRLPAMFVSMNAALFVGCFKWFLGRQSGRWARTERGVKELAFAVPNAEPPV